MKKRFIVLSVLAGFLLTDCNLLPQLPGGLLPSMMLLVIEQTAWSLST